MTGPVDPEVELTGGGRSTVHRRGDVVLRPSRPWSASVVSLLNHLREAGFDASPHPVGTGFDPDGREALTFVPGQVLHPATWSDEAITDVGALLRRLHEAVASFTPPPDAVWQPWFGRTLGAGPRIVSHCDTGPWNVLARDGRPVALLDWEFAGPVDPLVELAQAAWLHAQLMGDRVAALQGNGSVQDRAHQLRLLVDGYGLPRGRREHLLDLMVEVAVADAKTQADEADITPTSTDPTPLWAMTWRIDSAEWMLRHRSLLRDSLLRETLTR